MPGFKVLTQTIGYFWVGVFSLASGVALGFFNPEDKASPIIVGANLYETVPIVLASISNQIDATRVYNIFFLLFALAAYFFARSVLVDLPKDAYGNNKKREQSVWAGDMAICAIVVALVTHLVAQFTHQPLSGFNKEVLLTFAVAIPLLTWMFATRSIRMNDSGNKQRDAFSFANRVFYPSLFCCSLCFLYGWSILQGGDLFGPTIVLVISLTLTAMYLYTLRFSTNGGSGPSARFAILALATMVFVTPLLTTFLIPPDIFKIIVFALVVAFSLGVADVAQRIYSHKAEQRLVPSFEPADHYESGANWSALLLMPSLPLLGLLSNDIPVWFLAIYSGLFLAFWIAVPRKDILVVSWLCVGFGFMMPIWLVLALCVGITYPQSIAIAEYEGLSTSATILGLAYAAMGMIGGFIGGLGTEDFRKLRRNELAFKDIRNALILFMGVALGVIMLTVLTSPFMHLLNTEKEVFQAKVWEIQIFITILTFLALVAYLVISRNDPRPPLEQSNANRAGRVAVQKVDTADNEQSNRLFDLLLVGRPTISAIAGLAVLAMAISQPDIPMNNVVFGIATMTLVTMFGFVMNDIFDLPKDIRGERGDKLLVAGKVTEAAAKKFAVVLILLSIAAAWFAAGLTGVVFTLSLALALAYYSKFSETLPYAKGFYTACLCMAPLPLAEASIGQSFVPLSVYIFGLLFFVGRELLFDAVDFEADRKAGVITLAVILGKSFSIISAWIVMLVAILLPIPTLGPIGLFLVVANGVLLIAFAILSKERLLLSSNLTRINLLLGLGMMTDALV